MILREVSLAAKPPELLAASAKGTVPVLVLADGRVIDESQQIVRWSLEQDGRAWPGDRLAAQLIASCDGEFKALLDQCRYPERHANGDAAAARQQALTLLRQWNQELVEVPQTSQRPELQWLILPFLRQFRGLDAERFAQESGLEALRAWLDPWLEGPALQAVMASPWAERRAWHSPSWLYHLALAEDWRLAKRQGSYPWSTRGLRLDQVGFVHASWRHQVAATYQRFYADNAAVVLLALDPQAIAAAGVAIRQEPAPDTGEFFPHLYGPLPLEAVVLADPYPADARGAT
jgi:glutathione S-transferase